MVLDRFPYIVDILLIVVVGQSWWMWKCCKKAREAWDGVDYLYDWIENELKPAVSAALAACGCNSGPGWPPTGPGNFPKEN